MKFNKTLTNEKYYRLSHTHYFLDCPDSHKGCRPKCSEFCVVMENTDAVCDRNNGTCLHGCQDGYTTFDCSRPCHNGTFGKDCKNNCSSFCLPVGSDEQICNHIDGTCLNKCIDGYTTPFCNQICKDGTFGNDCGSECSQFCRNDMGGNPICDHINGTCLNGCENGYMSPWCNLTCLSGSYGDGCQFNCSRFCLLDTNGIPVCDNINGTCLCQRGYYMPECNQTCPAGYFGDGCMSTCSQFCVSNSENVSECDNINGTCLCQSGYSTPWCNKACPTGSYGDGCTWNCSDFCLLDITGTPVCDHITGTCECQSGYDTPWCNTTCPVGYFGDGCESTCSQFCVPNSENITACDHISGTCQCQIGYNTPWCNTTCPARYFGDGCMSTCSQFCVPNSENVSECDHISGTCLCQSGYSTSWCNDTCPVGSYGDGCRSHCSSVCLLNINGVPECDHVNGTCECQRGYSTPWCNQTCPAGQFGDGCMSTCSQFCVSNSENVSECDNIIGTCQCQIGYRTDWCNITCQTGAYGQDCRSNCSSFCLLGINGTPECDHINGSCDCQSGYVTPWCNHMAKMGSSPSAVGTITGGCIGAILAILIVAIGVFVFRRVRHGKICHPTRSGIKSNGNLSQVNINGAESSIGTELTKVPYTEHNSSESNTKEKKEMESHSDICHKHIPDIKSTAIPLTDLNTFLGAHPKRFFYDQFNNIKNNNTATMEVGLAEENRSKNRYRNIIPYDHSRVHLAVSDGYDDVEGYINASHVQGYNGMDAFIASQGPTKNTLENFVQMLWQQKTEKIVMLTNIIEQGKEKCEQYWPDEGEMKIGEFSVILTTTQVFADYTIRKLLFRKSGSKELALVHFHFTAWPDLDVPLTPWSLVDFEQRVSSCPTHKPIVVHCSAGVGRTGTFIAMQNILKQAKDKGHVDFFTTVQKLRHDRVSMVNTHKQYEFLHKAAQIALFCSGSSITSNYLQERIHFLEQKSDGGQIDMETEFKAVCAQSNDHNIDEDETTEESYNAHECSRNVKNKHKNRLSSIIPKSLYAPVLKCEKDNLEDYINAVFVPSFSKQNHHFLTQLPLPTTVIDFWRLITQNKVSLIVAFQDDLKDTDTTVGEYLPPCDHQVVTFSMFEIESATVCTSKLWQQKKVTVTTDTQLKNTSLSTSASRKEDHLLTHVSCTSSDLGPSNLLTLVGHIRSLNPGSEGRTVYTCRNGADYSGLVCVLCLLLDRMDHAGCFTVPLVVGAIKAVRPQVIPTLAQYQLLYRVLSLYSRGTVSTPV